MFFLTNEILLSDVSSDIWRRDDATSEYKKIQRLTKTVARPTQRMDFDTFENLNKQIRTNHKMMKTWSNISENSFFWCAVSLRIRFPVMICVWSMTHEKTGKQTRTKVDDLHPSSFKFRHIHDNNEISHSVHELCVMIRQVLLSYLSLPVFKTWKRRWRRQITEYCERYYWYQLRTWYRFWRSWHLSPEILIVSVLSINELTSKIIRDCDSNFKC